MTPTVLVRGLGSIGRRHAEIFGALGAEVHGWPVRARSGTLGGIRLVGDAEGAALLSRADLVVVATDTGRHINDALDALRQGAAKVLVEKPVSVTAEAARPLVDEPHSASRVFVAAPLRAHRGFLEFCRRVEALPAPRTAQVFSQSWLPDWRPGRDYRESYSARADEGGVLRDLVHEIDYAVAALGSPYAPSVHAVIERDGPLQLEAEQGASLLWRTPTATVTLRLDYTTRPTRRGALVTSAEGSVQWDPISGSVTATSSDGQQEATSFVDDLDRNTVMARQARAALALAPDGPAATLLAAGAPATLSQGVAAVGICDLARASGDAGVAAAHTTTPGRETL